MKAFFKKKTVKSLPIKQFLLQKIFAFKFENSNNIKILWLKFIKPIGIAF